MAQFKGFDFDSLKTKVVEGTKAVQESVGNTDIKAGARKALEDAVAGAGDAAKKISDKAKNFDADEAIKSISDTANSGVNNVAKVIDEMTGKKPETQESNEEVEKEFIRLFWFLAAADGDISQEERIKIEELAREIDEAFSEHLEALETECTERMKESGREFGRLNAAKVEAQKALEGLAASDQEKKALCWNLFAVANSDGISDDETDFIRFISEKAGIDASVIEELRNYSSAIIEISDTKEQLRSSGRSYGEIEPLVNELNHREQTIIESAQALITD